MASQGAAAGCDGTAVLARGKGMGFVKEGPGLGVVEKRWEADEGRLRLGWEVGLGVLGGMQGCGG